MPAGNRGPQSYRALLAPAAYSHQTSFRDITEGSNFPPTNGIAGF